MSRHQYPTDRKPWSRKAKIPPEAAAAFEGLVIEMITRLKTNPDLLQGHTPKRHAALKLGVPEAVFERWLNTARSPPNFKARDADLALLSAWDRWVDLFAGPILRTLNKIAVSYDHPQVVRAGVWLAPRLDDSLADAPARAALAAAESEDSISAIDQTVIDNLEADERERLEGIERAIEELNAEVSKILEAAKLRASTQG